VGSWVAMDAFCILIDKMWFLEKTDIDFALNCFKPSGLKAEDFLSRYFFIGCQQHYLFCAPYQVRMEHSVGLNNTFLH
jgi:hypothetical protein